MSRNPAAARTVLCFGDSNTWGYDPAASAEAPYAVRHLPEIRWTGVLAQELSAGWRIVEEGLNGRTTVFDDPLKGFATGLDYLPACLESHKPIDLVVLALGTNDLKAMFAAPAGEIAAGAGVLARHIRRSETGPQASAPQVLLVSPAPIGDMNHLPELKDKFAGGHEKSRRFPALYRAVAQAEGCAYLDLAPIVTPSAIDGLHYDAAAHQAIGQAVAQAIRALSWPGQS